MNFKILMHEKVVFCTKLSKKVPTMGGASHSHTLPLVSTETVPLPPLVLQSYILVARMDVNFNFIMHPKPGFSTPKIQKSPPSWETPSRGGGGGGGGTQIWFRRGCAAEAAKPIPIFKGHFGGKGYLLLRVFSQ